MIQTQISLEELYHEDEVAWYMAMVERLDAKAYDELDYINLRELLLAMPLRERHEVESRLAVLILHILKWEYQPTKRTRSWALTIVEQSQELLWHLRSKLLRNHAEETLEDVYPKAIRRAMIETGLSKAAFPTECQYTIAELLNYEATLDVDDLETDELSE